jgi:hypothetical protein
MRVASAERPELRYPPAGAWQLGNTLNRPSAFAEYRPPSVSRESAAMGVDACKKGGDFSFLNDPLEDIGAKSNGLDTGPQGCRESFKVGTYQTIGHSTLWLTNVVSGRRGCEGKCP